MPVPPPKSVSAMLSSELRTILLVVIVTIVIQIVPIDTFILKYGPIANLPYAGVLAKAISAGALFFVIRRYVST